MKVALLAILLVQIALTFGHPNHGPQLKRHYMISAFKANWFLANAHCHSLDMQLVSIGSPEETENIAGKIKRKGLDKESFWTSGTRLGNNGAFYWFGNGDQFTYTNWAANQPDNSSGVKGVEEECVAIEHFADYRWNDTPCLRQLYFVCEKFHF